MTTTSELVTMLAPQLGVAHTIHGAASLGGAFDVIEYRAVPGREGTHYVTSLDSPKARHEVVLVMRAPESWAPRLVAYVASLLPPKEPQSFAAEMPAGSPIEGIAMTDAWIDTVGGREASVGRRPVTNFDLAVGVTRDELAVCLSHGNPHVIELLRRASALPFSTPGRASVVTSSDVVPFDDSRLSEAGKQGLRGVLHDRSTDVSIARRSLTDDDRPRLAAFYDRLLLFSQRQALTYLVTDREDETLRKLWQSFVRDAAPRAQERNTTELSTLALALACLDGDITREARYRDDPGLAMSTARRRAGVGAAAPAEAPKTLALELAELLAPQLGPVEPTIHTALPPMHLGGGADVLEFRRVEKRAGVHYVTAGLSTVRPMELLLITRTPEPWAAPFLSRLAPAAAQRGFRHGSTVPLGDPSAPLEALAFVHLPGLDAVKRGKSRIGHQLVLGLTNDEVLVCRSHGTPHVLELLRRAQIFPYSERDRESIVSPADVAPISLEGMSPAAQRGLRMVLDADHEGVEECRRTFRDADVPLLAVAFERMIAWEQRCLFVNLVCDVIAPSLVPVWNALLADALDREIPDMTYEHIAVATALAGLDGDLGRVDAYLDGVDVTMSAIRTRLGRST